MMMTTTSSDQLVAGYLAALRAAAADLPRTEVDELVGDIAQHITESRAELAADDTAGALEYIGIGVLGLAPFFAPIIGPLVGLVLVSASPCWTRKQKVVAWVITLAPLRINCQYRMIKRTKVAIHRPTS